MISCPRCPPLGSWHISFMVHHHPPWFLGGLNSTKGRKTSRVDARTWWLWDKKNCQEIPRRLWSFSLVDFLWIFNELNGECSEGLGVGKPLFISYMQGVFTNKQIQRPTQWLDRQESSMAIQKIQAFRVANFELRNSQISQKLLGSTFFGGEYDGIWIQHDTTV